jgi:hypothetical protein
MGVGSCGGHVGKDFATYVHMRWSCLPTSLIATIFTLHNGHDAFSSSLRMLRFLKKFVKRAYVSLLNLFHQNTDIAAQSGQGPAGELLPADAETDGIDNAIGPDLNCESCSEIVNKTGYQEISALTPGNESSDAR